MREIEEMLAKQEEFLRTRGRFVRRSAESQISNGDLSTLVALARLALEARPIIGVAGLVPNVDSSWYRDCDGWISRFSALSPAADEQESRDVR